MLAGTAHGVAAWGAFAAVEIAACTLRPLAAGFYDVIEASHWRFAAVLLAAYLIAGALCGGVAGFLPARIPPRQPRSANGLAQTAATMTIVSLYGVNLLVEFADWELVEYVAFGLAALILLLLAARILFPSRFGWSRFAADPWTAAILLLGVPLFAGSPTLRNGVAIAVVLVSAAFVSRRYLSPGSSASGAPTRQLAAVILAIAAVLLSSGALTKDLPHLRAGANQPPPAVRHPNVVLVVMDTVRADHLSLYGYSRQTTPKLEKFAGEAIVYRRAIAASNKTLPSHASLFTGLYPRRHGAIDYPPGASANHLPLPAKRETLAEMLAAAGYVCAGVVANTAFVRPEFGLSQGFHLFDVREVAPILPEGKRYYPRRLMRRVMDQFFSTLEFDRLTRTASEITTDAIRLLEESRNNDRPFFLFVNYMDAHEPYVPPPPYDTMFPGRNRTMTYRRYVKMTEEVNSGSRPVSADERAHYISQYDGAIRHMDSEVDRLLVRLRKLGLFDESIIVITSDHGEAFGERNYVSHGLSLYQHQVFVPLVVKYVRRNRAGTEDRFVSNVDLLPTILEAAGLAAPRGVDGRSLLSPDNGERPPVFAESFTHSAVLLSHPNVPARQAAIFRDNLKLISSSNGRNELYNLRDDPAEQRDLRQRDSPAFHGLETELSRWLENFPVEVQPAKPIDSRTLERLKALGYVR